MKKKFPEWWMENRHYFEMASRLFFVPKKIKRVLTTLVETLDFYVFDDESYSLSKPNAPLKTLSISELTVIEKSV